MKIDLSLNNIAIQVDLSDIEYSASKYHPAVMYLRNGDPGYPEEGGFESVDAVWKEFPDKNGNKVRVNIVDIFDQDSLCEEVIKALDDEGIDYDGRHGEEHENI